MLSIALLSSDLPVLYFPSAQRSSGKMRISLSNSPLLSAQRLLQLLRAGRINVAKQPFCTRVKDKEHDAMLGCEDQRPASVDSWGPTSVQSYSNVDSINTGLGEESSYIFFFSFRVFLIFSKKKYELMGKEADSKPVSWVPTAAFPRKFLVDQGYIPFLDSISSQWKWQPAASQNHKKLSIQQQFKVLSSDLIIH